MAIAPSKLGEFVAQEGFSWPTNQAAATRDFGKTDEALVRRLRDTGLVRPDVADDEVAKTFQAARSEHAAGGYSPFNSPHERVRVFLGPYLTSKGLRWAEPFTSLALTDDDSGPPVASPWPAFSEPPSRWRTFWPDVADLSGAREAIQLGWWFAFLSAGLGGLGAIVSLFSGADTWSILAGATILALIGLGIRRRWRSAAVVGAVILGIGIAVRLASWAPPGVVDTLTFIAMLNGVRGTFAYARLTESAGPLDASVDANAG